MKKKQELTREEIIEKEKEKEKEARRNEAKYFIGLFGWAILGLFVVACIVVFVLLCLGAFN